jgi:hypothetical protein
MTLESMSEDEILRIANPIMDNLMDASIAIDHERHIRDFSERLKAIVTKEYLQKVCEKHQREKGYFSKREPVAVFERGAPFPLLLHLSHLPRSNRFGRSRIHLLSASQRITQGDHHGVLNTTGMRSRPFPPRYPLGAHEENAAPHSPRMSYDGFAHDDRRHGSAGSRRR